MYWLALLFVLIDKLGKTIDLLLCLLGLVLPIGDDCYIATSSSEALQASVGRASLQRVTWTSSKAEAEAAKSCNTCRWHSKTYDASHVKIAQWKKQRVAIVVAFSHCINDLSVSWRAGLLHGHASSTGKMGCQWVLTSTSRQKREPCHSRHSRACLICVGFGAWNDRDQTLRMFTCILKIWCILHLPETCAILFVPTCMDPCGQSFSINRSVCRIFLIESYRHACYILSIYTAIGVCKLDTASPRVHTRLHNSASLQLAQSAPWLFSDNTC